MEEEAEETPRYRKVGNGNLFQLLGSTTNGNETKRIDKYAFFVSLSNFWDLQPGFPNPVVSVAGQAQQLDRFASFATCHRGVTLL